MEEPKEEEIHLFVMNTNVIACVSCISFDIYECGGTYCKKNILFKNQRIPVYYSCALFEKRRIK